MTKDELITELLELWGNAIGCQHHKSRDFNFSITKGYSCYQEAGYTVEHHGYVLHYLPTYSEFRTLDEAEQYLIDLLTHGILGELDSALSDSDEAFSDLPVDRAREIKRELDELKTNCKEINFDRARSLN